MCRVEGPVVPSIDFVFATDWYMETGSASRPRRLPPARPVPGRLATLVCQVVPSGPGFQVENNLQLFLSLLYSARERIIITSPYFVPDDSMLRGLMAATGRGRARRAVRLRDRRPGDGCHAQRSYYEALLRRSEDLPLPCAVILHAKHLSIDDNVAVIGSSNMDMRSFGLNSEISMLVRSRCSWRRCGGGEELPGDQHGADAREWQQEPDGHELDGLGRLTSALQ